MRKLIVVLTCLFLVLLSGCSSNQTVSSDAKNKTSDTSTVTNNQIDETSFYGEWQVKNCVPSNEPSNDFLMRYIDTYVTLDQNFAASEGASTKAYFKIDTLSKSDFLQDYKADLKTLGIEGDSVTKVTIYTAPDYTGIWGAFGTEFFVIDQDTLFVAASGYFFELKKTDPSTIQNETNNGTGENPSGAAESFDETSFYGEWQVTKKIPVFTVTTDEADEQNIIGQKITYTKDTATSEDSSIKPYYEISKLSDTDFYDDYKTTPKLLGIDGDSVTYVIIYTDEAYKNTWEAIGSTFSVKDQNTLILCEDGLFFEMERVK